MILLQYSYLFFVTVSIEKVIVLKVLLVVIPGETFMIFCFLIVLGALKKFLWKVLR